MSFLEILVLYHSCVHIHSPPKIKSIRIVDNPFPDIVPRITAAERQEQQRAKEQAQRERGEEQRRKGAKKFVPKCRFKDCNSPFYRNVKLLSFGADEEAGEEESTFKKKPIFRPERMPSYITVKLLLTLYSGGKAVAAPAPGIRSSSWT